MVVEKEKDGFIYQTFDENGFINGNMTEIQERLKKEVRADDIFVDLGAHIGTMSIPVIAAVRPRKSILVEANPGVIPLLKANVEKNLPGLDVEVVNAVICDRDEMVDFSILTEKADSSSFVRQDIVDGGKKVQVQGMTLARLLRDIQKDVYMKVDIECAELLMFKGMGTKAKYIRGMVMEWFRSAISEENAKELLLQIYGAGFQIYTLDRHPMKLQQLMESTKDDILLERV